METIAEGVETEAQLELLRKLGCPAAQGYYWARPLLPERAFEMLAADYEHLTKIAS
jgi:EAL domain-containing protein (putative c-di-GMP-specific phosphodiesterase class I)